MKKKRTLHLSWNFYSWLKCFFIMKLTALILFVFCFSAHANLYSQHAKVSLDMKNARLTEVLNELKNQTQMDFFYSSNLKKVNELVNIKAKDKEWNLVLDEILTELGLDYVIDQELIIIKEKAVQQKQIKISGKVTDEKRNPIPGVTILLEETTIGTSTDVEGNFNLSLPVEKGKLVFSFIGFQEKKVEFTGDQIMNITLLEDVKEIEEVVVTGIFTKSRESYTGAVTTITAEELKKFGNRSVLSQIKNIDPSFNIIENNTYGSDPNRLPNIEVRGATSLDIDVRDLQNESSSLSSSNLPLFILDGFEITLQRMNDMDENLIETITLLKDASATAMYGSRGANGVIVITTKRPEPGKLRFTYKGDLNIEVSDLSSYNLLNAREKLEYEVAANVFVGSTLSLMQSLTERYNELLAEVVRGVDTYWLKYPIQTGVGHRHSLRIDGGDENFRYALGISYNNIEGVMKKSNRNTISLNSFLQYNFGKVSLQNDLTYTVNNSKNSPYGNFSDYTKLNAYRKPYDDEGNLIKILDDYQYNQYTSNRLVVANPLYNATLPYRNTAEYNEFQNNFSIDWEALQGLKARGRFTITKMSGRADIYLSANHTDFEDYEGDDYQRRGSYDYSTNYTLSYEGDFTLNYSKTFGEKHLLYAGLNYNIAEEKYESFAIKAEGYAASNIKYFGIGNSYEKNGSPTGNESISRRLGGAFTTNYTYDRRYFVDFSGRIEASSKFGAKNRTAPFWSSGIGWNLHNEKFMDSNPIVNTLRLRLSYGTTGSQNFNAYQAMTIYRYFSDTHYRGFNGSSIIALGNEDLGWQKTGQLNIGFETLLFNGILSLRGDLYNKNTDDLLSDINVPTASGFNSYKANIGKVRNRGYEFYANLYLIRNHERNMTWSVGGNIIHNKNKILKISNSLEFLNEELLKDSESTNPSLLYKEGQSLKTIYVVKSLGIDPSNGEEIYLTTDGEKTYTWNELDKVPCGVNEAKYRGTFNTLFRYKGLSFNTVFSYRLGGDIYNQTLIDKVENVNPRYNADKRVFYDRWKKPGDHAYFKSVTNTSTTRASSRFVMRENTLECNSINIAYDLKEDWIRRFGLNYLSVAFYTEDVFRVSTIKQERGTSYPFSRKFSFGITARL